MTQALRHPSDPNTHLRAEKKKKKRWASTLFRIYGQVYAVTLYVLESQDYGNIEERTMKIRSNIKIWCLSTKRVIPYMLKYQMIFSKFQPILHEGQIISIRRISVDRAKTIYRAVDNPLMIRLNQYTEITEPKDPAPDFPKYTFSLTPISELNQYIGNQGTFLDVMS